jgi:hypothetical protein
MIYGCRIEKNIPCVKEIYSSIFNQYCPGTVLLNESLYVECDETEVDEYELTKANHQILLNNGWVCWDDVLIKRYLARVLSNTPFIMYKQNLGRNIPRFSEMKWDIAFNHYDSAVADIFTQNEEVAKRMIGTFKGQIVEFPGIFADPACIPMY